MELIKKIQPARELINASKSRGKKIGLVPTMGALHAGHTALINAALRQCDFVVVSIFVNPTQFAPGEDYEKYPRPIKQDLEICRRHNVDMVFAPTAEEMYPTGNLTWVNVEKLTEPLCGRLRPGHFRGVTTVCAKLFNIIQPHTAFFGQKDAQQAVVIKRMVHDLNFNLDIEICPIVREPDGLAVSSRNKYLSPAQRKDATVLYCALQQAAELVDRGTRDADELTARIKNVLETPSVETEYIDIVDPASLEPVKSISGPTLIAVAARVGPARLIDNIIVDLNE